MWTRRAWLASAFSLPALGQNPSYDTVIRGGRVMDPESGLDAVRNVGIRAGKVEMITDRPIEGRTTIEARELVVAPGFIDVHSHGQDPENYRYKAMDGVTTALELEIGVADVDAWYGEREGRALIDYGASVGHAPVRMKVMRDPAQFLPTGDAAHRAAREDEIAAMKQGLEEGLRRGALAVGFGLAYTPAASRWEILEMFRTAAKAGAPCHVHIRGEREEALEEVLAAAAITGAPLHVVHITSVGLESTPHLLRMLGEARARGMDVSTELYPYTAAMTEIESAMFDGDWQRRLGISYPQVQWVQTGERLTAESFARYRKQGGMVIMHMIPEAALQAALRSPLAMIASDGVINEGKGHPRGSGSYARVLGRYVRETQMLSLAEALRKMTLMPARRLERHAPAMKNKGRLRAGADADITVFDPRRVIDRSTFEEPARYSEGIRYVLVNGTLVVKEGQLQNVAPGRGIRAL